MEITIRTATPEDAHACARVNIASWHSTYRGQIADEVLDSMKIEDYLKKWNRILSGIAGGTPALQSVNFCFVAENETGEIVGYCSGGKNSHDTFSFEGELYAIYLLKEYQGKGIGKKLFLRTLEEFKLRKISSFLLFVLSSNTNTRAFYESFNPDFTANETITIDNGQYCDICYGWTKIATAFDYQ
jgi:ribosomal protein S18 acetylase RimI-like enzyme